MTGYWTEAIPFMFSVLLFSIGCIIIERKTYINASFIEDFKYTDYAPFFMAYSYDDDKMDSYDLEKICKYFGSLSNMVNAKKEFESFNYYLYKSRENKNINITYCFGIMYVVTFFCYKKQVPSSPGLSIAVLFPLVVGFIYIIFSEKLKQNKKVLYSDLRYGFFEKEISARENFDTYSLFIKNETERCIRLFDNRAAYYKDAVFLLNRRYRWKYTLAFASSPLIYFGLYLLFKG